MLAAAHGRSGDGHCSLPLAATGEASELEGSVGDGGGTAYHCAALPCAGAGLLVQGVGRRTSLVPEVRRSRCVGSKRWLANEPPLRSRGGLYDIIEADALRPNSAYAGNLYSVEYFDLMRRHLRPGGFGVTWQPTLRTRDTFLQAFPYVMTFGSLLVGSSQPIAYERSLVEARMQSPYTRAYFERAQVRLAPLVRPELEKGPVSYTPAFDRSRLRYVNTDLFPRDEYMVSARFLAGGLWSPQPRSRPRGESRSR